ncbi:MAG: ATP-dependent Clp protease adaptor ClpS [Holophagales bacterium]|jgi:ATP-dependent Clp protease adaptor protein ClpS|nr:ATP-dependent Clp protease adaptor ClpS [Holophagales bacterium]
MSSVGANPKQGAGLLTDSLERLQAPPLYRVILHNDDYTTRDFVVFILQQVFRKPEPEAVSIMLAVHNMGIGVAGVYSYQVAETKVEQVTRLAEKHEFPLLCTFEPDV